MTRTTVLTRRMKLIAILAAIAGVAAALAVPLPNWDDLPGETPEVDDDRQSGVDTMVPGETAGLDFEITELPSPIPTPTWHGRSSSPPRKGKFERSEPFWPAGNGDNKLSFSIVDGLTEEFDIGKSQKYNMQGDLDAVGCAAWLGPSPLYLDSSGNLTEVQNGRLRVKLTPKKGTFSRRRSFIVWRAGRVRVSAIGILTRPGKNA